MAFPYPQKMKKTMIELGIPQKIIDKFDPFVSRDFRQEQVIPFINQMEKLLSPEQCLLIMERQGCCKTGKNDVATRAFGLEHAGKTIKEKVKLLPKAKIPYNIPCNLNDDDTLTAFFENYKCGCYGIRKLSEQIKIPRTYCGCCGGFMRHHLQNALGVSLRLKEIVPSPNSSNEKKRCEFLFEILKQN
jgi:hypothetical protein